MTAPDAKCITADAAWLHRTYQQPDRDWTAAYRPPMGTTDGGGTIITDLSYAIAPGGLMFESHDGLPADICQPFERHDRYIRCTASSSSTTLDPCKITS